MQIHEGSPQNSPDAFGMSRLIVKGYVDRLEEEKTAVGKAIRKEIDNLVSGIGKDKLPESIFVKDITRDGIRTPSFIHKEQVRYFPSTKSLFVVDREVIKVGYSNPIGNNRIPAQPSYFPIPEAEQTHKVIREIDEKEWLGYGETVVNALEKAVKESQEAKT